MGVLSVRTIVRNADYATPVTLWKATVAVAPHNYRAHNNLADSLDQEGDADGAIECFRTAQELKPDSLVIALNLQRQALLFLVVAACKMAKISSCWKKLPTNSALPLVHHVPL